LTDLVRVNRDAGERHDVAGAQWIWKIRGAQTNGAFCFFEMNVQPGQGVPLHLHGYPEAFYILEGELEFQASDQNGKGLKCGVGDVVLAQRGVRHAFFNRTENAARLLSMSTAAHEPFFDEIVAADRERPFAAMPPEEIFARIAAIGERTDTRFVVGS
jgi:quercetin dioxygenase-like cupin family protein